MIKFIEVKSDPIFNKLERRSEPRFALGEVWINPDSVVKVEPNVDFKRLLTAGALPTGLHHAHEFSRITTTEGRSTECYIVVGEASSVAQKLSLVDTRQLLKG
jgi:hypothetical protein